MNCEIISVGTELLLGTTVDSNAATAGRKLAEWGINCRHRQTVGDNLDRLVEAVRLAISRSDLVLMIGGLGPTVDDLTREGVAKALGQQLEVDPEILGQLKERFEKRGMRWVESNAKQAERPKGSVVLENPHGTAPGLVFIAKNVKVACLPGPPREFEPMLNGPLARVLGLNPAEGALHSRVIRVTGLGESRIQELLGELFDSENPTVAPYAKEAEVHLRLSARAVSEPEAAKMFAPVEALIRRKLGRHVYGMDDSKLEHAILDKLGSRTLATAESCTAGLVAYRLTGMMGSSQQFKSGFVTYSNQAKADMLGVSAGLIQEHSAVSEQVAAAMAEGCRTRLGTTFGLSVTGVAGTGPDDNGNPEGLVYLGLAWDGGSEVRKYQFSDRDSRDLPLADQLKIRETIRVRAAQAALTLLWDRLCDLDMNPEN